MNDMLYKKIEELGLSVRCINCLHSVRITLVSDLVRFTEKQILKTHNLGKKQLSEIKDAVARYGLELGTYVPDEEGTVKIDTDAEYVLEAYWWERKLVDNVVKDKKKHMLACIACYREHEDPDSQLEEILALKDALIHTYRFYPEGEVCVKLTIKEEFVNV